MALPVRSASLPQPIPVDTRITACAIHTRWPVPMATDFFLVFSGMHTIGFASLVSRPVLWHDTQGAPDCTSRFIGNDLCASQLIVMVHRILISIV